MSPAIPFDITALTSYLEAHVSGLIGPITLEKFTGGQSNPTYKITAVSGNYVLRRQPPGQLLKSAHAVDREYRVLAALKNTAVPVPEVFHLCEDKNIIGSIFYVMEFCDGQIYWNAALPEIKSKEINSNETDDKETDHKKIRAAMYDAMNQTLVALHSVDIKACGLQDYGSHGDYFQRQLSRWSQQYQQSALQPIAAMDELMSWLQAHLPENDGRITLVHGDYRLDNIMFSAQKPEIIAVLDWELSTLGHPFADLAYQCMQLRMPQGLGSIQGLQGIDRAGLGIPSEEEYVARYCQRMGIPQIENWTFCLAFSFFRLAAIVQGVAKRSVQGNASNENAAKVGAFVKPLAQMALAVISEEKAKSKTREETTAS